LIHNDEWKSCQYQPQALLPRADHKRNEQPSDKLFLLILNACP
jgi:hypothetical protein